jgi:hypothetical protein
MHDTNLDERLRSVLRREGDGLPFTITTDELERRLLLRRRERNGRRLSLMAAGVAAVAVGAIFALSNGWLSKAPVVGTDATPSPAPTATPATTPVPSSPGASLDPLAALPVLAQDPGSIDFYSTESAGDPSNTDPVLGANGLDGVRMEAREAGVKIACLGPDARFRWGWDVDRTAVASDTVTCDGTIQSYRYDVAAFQPMFGQIVVFEATPRTAFRILVETFGSTNDPVPTALPSFAIPPGTVVDDVALTKGASASGDPVALLAGQVPPRSVYRVAMVCLGEGVARWSIGAENTQAFVTGGEVPCTGAAIGFETDEGTPPTDTDVWVTTEPTNRWHIVVTDPYGAPSFIAPSLAMWPTGETPSTGGVGLSTCVSHGEGGDSCAGPYHARDGAAEVTIPRNGDLTVQLGDGWRIGQARITAVLRDEARADGFVNDVRDVGYQPDGGDPLSFSVGDLEEGEWIVRVSLNATKGADTFGALYDIPVNIAGLGSVGD